MTYRKNFVMGRVENIIGKGENAGYQHFLLFPQCFQKVLFIRAITSRDFVVKGYLSICYGRTCFVMC